MDLSEVCRQCECTIHSPYRTFALFFSWDFRIGIAIPMARNLGIGSSSIHHIVWCGCMFMTFQMLLHYIFGLMFGWHDVEVISKGAGGLCFFWLYGLVYLSHFAIWRNKQQPPPTATQQITRAKSWRAIMITTEVMEKLRKQEQDSTVAQAEVGNTWEIHYIIIYYILYIFFYILYIMYLWKVTEYPRISPHPHSYLIMLMIWNHSAADGCSIC